MRFGLCIPTLNADPFLPRLVEAIRRQDLTPDAFIVIDFMSDDATPRALAALGAEVFQLDRDRFDHGGTRQLAVERLPDCDVILFLTQDAIPSDRSAFRRLLAAFADDRVGAAYGRQLPRPGAGPLEAYSRIRNYGPVGHRRSAGDIPRLGIRAAFMSNAFAAYRRKALTAIGGFPTRVIFGEDMHAAAALLKAGWVVEYRADARVEHSHDYTTAQEFRRYFDVGVMMARSTLLAGEFGGPTGEGAAHVRQLLLYLSRRAPALVPLALWRASMSMLAYSLGRHEAMLPPALKRRLGVNRRFWPTPSRSREAASGEPAVLRRLGT